MTAATAVLSVADRDRQTVRTACGVRTDPTHWASATVHAHRTWTGEATILTWCGLDVDLSAGARQTTDLVSCLSCGRASWLAFRDGGR